MSLIPGEESQVKQLQMQQIRFIKWDAILACTVARLSLVATKISLSTYVYIIYIYIYIYILE